MLFRSCVVAKWYNAGVAAYILWDIRPFFTEACAQYSSVVSRLHRRISWTWLSVGGRWVSLRKTGSCLFGVAKVAHHGLHCLHC